MSFKTKKYKQKGGEPYNLNPKIKQIFNELYNTKMHTLDNNDTKQLNKRIIELKILNIQVENITSSSRFITIEDIYNNDSNVYTDDFKKYINESKKIISDERISDESKYIKMSDSFSKLCFDDSFKNKLIKHIVNLRYISIYNHDILLLQLKECIVNMYITIGNCDEGFTEKNMPIGLREFFSNVITNSKNMSNSVIKLISNNLSLIDNELSLKNTNTKENANQISSFFNRLRDEWHSIGQDFAHGKTLFSDTRTSLQSTIPQTDINEVEETKKNVIDKLKIKTTINSARTGFTLLVNYYKENTISALDLKWELETNTVGNAIQKYDLANAAKNALQSEITRIKILATDPSYKGSYLTNVARGLGWGLIPISFGISFIGGILIENLVNYITEHDLYKTLNENKMYNENFIKSKKEFRKILYDKKETIQPSSINSCEPNVRNTKYSVAYKLYDDYTQKCIEYFDNYLQEFINFKYIYNLLCDKTPEQIVNYINSNDNDINANQENIEEKVNNLYKKIESVYCKDLVLLGNYHYKDPGNKTERTIKEKKEILRKGLSESVILRGIKPNRLRCSSEGEGIKQFVKEINPFLQTNDITNQTENTFSQKPTIPEEKSNTIPSPQPLTITEEISNTIPEEQVKKEIFNYIKNKYKGFLNGKTMLYNNYINKSKDDIMSDIEKLQNLVSNCEKLHLSNEQIIDLFNKINQYSEFNNDIKNKICLPELHEPPDLSIGGKTRHLKKNKNLTKKYKKMKGGEASYNPNNNGIQPNGSTINNEFIQVDEQQNNLLGLGFETEELEMIENMPYDGIVRAYVETADQDYNINLPDINAVIQAAELSDVIQGTQVTKRNIASQTLHNLLNQSGGRRRKRQTKKRRSKKSRKSRKTRKYRR